MQGGDREELRWTRRSYLARFSEDDDALLRPSALRGCLKRRQRVMSRTALGHLQDLTLALERLRLASSELLDVLTRSRP